MDSLEQAKSHLQAGEFGQAREVALAALASEPENPGLLRVAGRAGTELAVPDAPDQLRRLTELEPDSAEAWRELGEALIAEGRGDEAADALRRAVELDPADEGASTSLGHLEFAAGRGADGVARLERIAERVGGSSSAAISLVEMYRAVGDTEKALAAAREVAAAAPEDLIAQLDVAQLAVEAGELDDAEAALVRVRELDDVPEHDVYALHGLALVAMRRGEVDRALEIAREALAVDDRGASADLALHLDIEAGGSGDVLAGRASTVVQRVPPAPDEIDTALVAEMGEHRRLHAEDRRPLAEDLLG